jgi:hypothetical protein
LEKKFWPLLHRKKKIKIWPEEAKAKIFFPTLGGQIIYFIYKKSIGCPQNKPGNKRTKL